MDTLIFSQSGIYRLQQLASQYYHQTGVRHKLSSPEGVLQLLNGCADTSQRDVRRCYDAFVMELNKRQIDALTSRGVRLRVPPSAVDDALARQAG